MRWRVLSNHAAFEQWVQDNAVEATPLVEACRSLAVVIDSDPSNASLWREYRSFLDMVVTGVDDDLPDAIDELLAELRSPLGDSAEE